MGYLNDSMSNLQGQVKESTETETFGTVIGTVSVEPTLGVGSIIFKYVFTADTNKDWFVNVSCGSAEKHSYDYSFTVVDYLEEKPATSGVEMVSERGSPPRSDTHTVGGPASSPATCIEGRVHVSRIIAKLGAANRTEIAGMRTTSTLPLPNTPLR